MTILPIEHHQLVSEMADAASRTYSRTVPGCDPWREVAVAELECLSDRGVLPVLERPTKPGRLVKLPVSASGSGVLVQVTVSLDSLAGLLDALAEAYRDEPGEVGQWLEDLALANDSRRAIEQRATYADVPDCALDHAARDALIEGCGLADPVVDLAPTQAMELADQLHTAVRPDRSAIGGAA